MDYTKFIVEPKPEDFRDEMAKELVLEESAELLDRLGMCYNKIDELIRYELKVDVLEEVQGSISDAIDSLQEVLYE